MAVCLVVFLLALPLASSLTVQIPPRSAFCFYENVYVASEDLEGRQSASFIFTVLKGGRHRDIIATGASEHKHDTKVSHFTDTKVNKGDHKLSLVTGNYSLCFDNSFSLVTTKTVEFVWKMPARKISSVPTAPSALQFSLKGVDKQLGNMMESLKLLRYRGADTLENAKHLKQTVDVFSMITLSSIVVRTLVEVYCIREFFANRASVKC